MSKVARNKKYLNLQGVRVSYRPKDDSIHLTSVDGDLAGEGFHLKLNKGSESESVLRELLVEKKLIRVDVKDETKGYIQGPLPERATRKTLTDQLWNIFSIGVAEVEDESSWNTFNLPSIGEASWNVRSFPHVLISGPTGTGKSVIQRSLFYHCLAHNKKWEFYGIDLKKVELSPYKKYTHTVSNIATTLKEGLEVLKNVHAEMHKRYQLMEDAGVNNFEEIPGDPHRAIMVMIDEANLLLSPSGIKTDEGKAEDAMQNKASKLIAELLRLGRAAGIHLVICTQRPDPAMLTGEMKANIDVRIAAGRMDLTPSCFLLGSGEAADLPGIRGRGVLRVGGETKVFQGYFQSQSFGEEWVLEHGKDIEPELYELLLNEGSK
jgi:hypothetical protein